MVYKQGVKQQSTTNDEELKRYLLVVWLEIAFGFLSFSLPAQLRDFRAHRVEMGTSIGQDSWGEKNCTWDRLRDLTLNIEDTLKQGADFLRLNNLSSSVVN